MTGSIVISGLGLVSPLGHGAWPTFRALDEGATLADRAADLPETIDPVELVRACGCVSTAQHGASDPVVELAERAAREALFESNTNATLLPCMVGTSKGAVRALTCALAEPLEPDQRKRLLGGSVKPILVPDAQIAGAYGPHAYLSLHLQKRLGVVVLRQWIAACASSLTALHQARRLLLTADDVNRVLVVTAEAALLPAFIHSYRRLGVLAPLSARSYCGRPLDARRHGFMLSEIGAAVVLERVDTPAAGQIELVDTAIATEAGPLVRTPLRMDALAHLAQNLLGRHRVDVLHPHATGTREFDPVELMVYRDLLSVREWPDIYAVKGALGHGMGAGGLVSLVVACLCARVGRRPHMPWLHQPLAFDRRLETHPPANGPSQTHGVFTAGFGGHVAAAIIRRV